MKPLKDKKKLKIFLIAFVLSLPFWWGINSLAKNLEDFWFLQEITKNPEILAAQLNQQILEAKIKDLRLEKLRTERLENLEIAAKAVISIEIDGQGRERILFEKNSKEPLPIASLTKLMTALVIFDLDETYNFSLLVPITEKAVEQENSSKYADFKIGEELSVETLLYIMLIESSNDAAFALAELIGEKPFVELMSFYAKDLELKNTQFVNPTGLDPDDPQEPQNLSTSRDLVKLSKYIFKNYPQIFEITTNKSYEVLNPDGSVHHFIPENTNELLGEIPGIIGGKTGWSPTAGGCLLLILKNPQKDSYFINVILGAGDRFAEMRKLIEAIGNY